MSDNEPEEEQPEEGAMALLEAQQEAQDAHDARVQQTEEKNVTDTAIEEVTEDAKNMSVEESFFLMVLFDISL
eukprot:g9431.t1